MNNKEKLKTSLELENVKGKISVLTKYLQKYTFELKKLQLIKDNLEKLLIE